MKKLFLSIALVASIYVAKSQGCSDAGFCSIGDLKPSNLQKDYKQKLTIGLVNGIGDDDVFVFTPSVQYDKKFNSKFSIQAKLTANYASGNLGNAFGLGDIFTTAIFSPETKSKWKSSYILGAKIPFNNSNLKADNRFLPMQYQSSLGTFDLIAGYNISNESWQFAAAAQLPLTANNGNEFFQVITPGKPDYVYPPSYKFKRKADVLLRVNKKFEASKKFNYNVGLLSVYHVANDEIKDFSDKNVEIPSSDGLTINLTAACYFNINKKFQLGFNAGTPLQVRDIRPDGLTRKFVVAADLIFNF